MTDSVLLVLSENNKQKKFSDHHGRGLAS